MAQIDPNPLQDKAAVVTGGAVRIGREIALALAEAGCDVCVHYGSSQAEALAVAAEIEAAGRQAHCVQADLSDACAASQKVVAAAIDRFGRIDVLVNNAAIFEPSILATTDEDCWDRHLAINLKAPFFLCREFAAATSNGRRSIVNILDWRAMRPAPGHAAYTAAKSGLAALTMLLAQELAPEVRVNGVAPGAILPADVASSESFAQLAERIPLNRTGSPRDVVDAVLYLLRAEFVTGQILHVTGGQELAADR